MSQKKIITLLALVLIAISCTAYADEIIELCVLEDIKYQNVVDGDIVEKGVGTVFVRVEDYGNVAFNLNEITYWTADYFCLLGALPYLGDWLEEGRIVGYDSFNESNVEFITEVAKKNGVLVLAICNDRDCLVLFPTQEHIKILNNLYTTMVKLLHH